MGNSGAESINENQDGLVGDNASVKLRRAGIRLLAVVLALIMVGSAFVVIAPFVSAGPGAVFSPPHSDHGSDTNANGYDDWLAIDAQVTIDAAAVYHVDAMLWDTGLNFITQTTSGNMFLIAGPHTITLYLSGRDIWNQGMYDTGLNPWEITLDLWEGATFRATDNHFVAYSWATFEPPANLAPPHSDYGSDTNANGYYDWLYVDVNVNVQTAGWYDIWGDLYDTGFNYVTFDDNYLYLNAGPQTVTLSYDGNLLWQNGFYGSGQNPSEIDLTLYDNLANIIETDIHSLSYLYSDFEPDALLAPPHSDWLSDTDGDGYADWLVVDVNVNVVAGDFYTVYGELYDDSISYIGWAENYLFLAPGLQTVELYFDGHAIWNNGAYGPTGGNPWEVDLYLYQGYYARSLEFDAYFNLHSWTLFEPPASLAPPHSDYGSDTNGNGYYDALVVDVQVDVDTAGMYYLYGDLYDTGSWGTTWDDNYLWLNAGSQTVTLSFDGRTIWDQGMYGTGNDPWFVNLYLYDDWSNLLDTGTHYLGYSWTAFEPPALFDPPYGDYVTDGDSNGIYEFLVVQVPVDVVTAGWYDVQALLEFVTWLDNYTFLSAGPQIVELWFSGGVISDSGVDGPYTVDLYLWDNWWNLVDSDTYVTGPYLASDFEAPASLGWPFVDFGLDTDADGLFNNLIVTVPVEVTTAGSYELDGWLYDGSWNQIEYITWTGALISGTNYVDIEFTGQTIFNYGLDSQYIFMVDLFFGSIYLENQAAWTSTSYVHTDFEHAMFAPPHTDYGVDTDADGLYNSLVVDVQVDIDQAGWYTVTGDLFSGPMWIDSALSDVLLPSGINTVTLTFDGLAISDSMLDGPYAVDLVLSQDSSAITQDTGVHFTAAYSWLEFEHTILAPPHFNYVTDYDGDGSYEYYVLEVSVEVLTDGWYTVVGDLWTMTDGYIESDDQNAYLTAGIQTVELQFSGYPFWWWAWFTAEPLMVDLYLYDDYGDLLDQDLAYPSSSTYSWWEFESPAWMTGSSEVGIDTNGNSFFDSLVEDLTVQVSAPGWYTINGEVWDSADSTLIVSDSTTVLLGIGVNVVSLFFDGLTIFNSGFDGPYNLHTWLFDVDYNYMGSDSLATAAYSHYQFEHSYFAPPHSDYGEDLNANGYYDQLVVSVQVQITTDGWYTIDGELYDDLSNWVTWDYQYLYLTAGPQTVMLFFDSYSIYYIGLYYGNDIGYVDLYLYEGSYGATLDSDTHFVSYAWTDFDPPAEFAPPHSDYGSDTNANGYYDLLTVQVEVDVIYNGWYTVGGDLYDQFGWYIDSDSSYLYLTAGINIFDLTFSGRAIWDVGMYWTGGNPGYVDLYLNDGSSNLIDTDVYSVSPYIWQWFEPPALLAPPHSDSVSDTNGNGYYDLLTVDVQVNVVTDGWYYVDGYLYDAWPSLIDNTGVWAYLTAGVQTVSLSFNGRTIWDFGNVWGGSPDHVNLILYDNFLDVLDSGVHFVSAHLWSEFEPPALLAPPYGDYGEDLNGNGQYDNLVISVPVEVQTDGWYDVWGYLYDAFPSMIGMTDTYTYLTAGLNTVELRFDGLNIWWFGYVWGGSPDHVFLQLWDDYGDLLDTDTHYASYSWTEFEPPAMLAPPHSDYGVDTDADGEYNSLNVDVGVYVTTAGWYDVDGYLYDGYSTFLGSDSQYVFLGAGYSTVTISFPGSPICMNYVDGPYEVDLELWDDWSNLIDTDTYWTAGYAYWEFEHPADFAPGHTHHGQDTNANGLYEWLVVDVNVDVTVAGTYEVSGLLYDDWYGWVITAASDMLWLNAGPQTVSLMFSGYDIWYFNYWYGGWPWYVDLTLRNGVGDYLDSDSLGTFYFPWQFDPPAEFAPPHSDYGDDTNANGYYDELVVDVDVAVNYAGWYYVIGDLYDGIGTYLTSDMDYLWLGTGLQTVELRFDGNTIWSNGRYGTGFDPSYVDLYLFDDWTNQIDTDTHFVAYSWTWFEPAATFDPPHTGYGIDSDLDGYYEYYALDVVVNVLVAGSYTVSGTLWDATDGPLTSNSVYTYLNAGTQTVTLMFNGLYIWAGWASAEPLYADLYLYDDWSNLIDTDTFDSSPQMYSWWDFEGPATFSVFSDYGSDTNGNGLYDWLVTDIDIGVNYPGLYTVVVTLCDGSWTTIASDSTTIALVAGDQIVSFQWDGLMIYDYGYDGAFNLAYQLVDDFGNTVSSSWPSTGSYTHMQFEHTYFAPPHSDYGSDTNANGYYDWLVVQVDINVTYDGWYTVYGDLYDTGFNYICWAENYVYLTVGLRTVDLVFSGRAICDDGRWMAADPWEVDLYLYDGWYGAMLDTDVYYTSHSWTEFEPPALLDPPHSDYGSDTNGNGYYDWLVVDVQVNVQSDAWYFVEGYLYDAWPSMIDYYGNWFYLTAGIQTVSLTFDGRTIYDFGYVWGGSPDHVDIGLYDWAGPYLLDTDTHYVSYLWAEFEPPASFAPPHSGYGVDSDANGLYEYYILEVEVNVLVPDWYSVQGELWTVTDGYAMSDMVVVYLNAGIQTVTLRYDGWNLWMENFGNEPLYVDLYLYDNSANLIDTDMFDSSPSTYSWWDFESPIGMPWDITYSDYGSDTNGNGLYDDFVVQIDLPVGYAGWYTIDATLCDSTWNSITTDSTFVYLNLGWQSVYLYFDGVTIYNYGFDGSFNVDVFYYDDFGSYLFNGQAFTSSYNHMQFEHTYLAPPHSDYGSDTNGNGFYDELVVQTQVYATYDGWYTVYGDLYDTGFNYICWAENYVYLTVGMNTVDLAFDGRDIYDNGRYWTGNDPWEVDLYLYDGWYGAFLDSDLHYVGYSWTSFEPPALLAPPHSDYGEDLNGNGQYDNLVISVQVDVQTDGWYTVWGYLYDAWPSMIDMTSNYVYLTAGLDTVDLRFNGVNIWYFGYVWGGSPDHVNLVLYDDFGYVLDTDTHYVSYLWTWFEPPAQFAPPHSDLGLDTSANGYYDWLEVDVQVYAAQAGWYYVYGDLYDTSSFPMGSTNANIWLWVGLNTVSLYFDGRTIWDQGAYVTGGDPWYVDLYLYDSGLNWLETNTHYVSYSWDEFEPPAFFVPPHSDYGDDTNANGYYDELVVDAWAYAYVGGWYTLEGYLYDTGFWNIGYDSAYLWLSPGWNWVELRYDGRSIWDNGMYWSGEDPWYVDLQLSDNWWNFLDSDIHYVSYSWTEFEPPALLDPPHSDYGSDTNGNGYYDWLVVDVQVDVQTAGWYYLWGALYDTDDWYITQNGQGFIWLNAGIQTMTLQFDGRAIWDQGMYWTGEDPWYVELELYDDWWNSIDSGTHYLGPYSWSDFEPPALFTPPPSDYGQDANGNGFYDWLVVDVQVNVVSPGWYTVYGDLYDTSVNWIASDSDYLWLAAGLQTVTLAFDGVIIWDHGDATGLDPSLVALSLYDDWPNWLDSDVDFVTYLYTDFEQPSSFAPPHSDYGSDTNGNGFYDELVVDVQLTIVTSGWYHLYGDLYDTNNWYTSSDVDYLWLNAGSQTVTLYFDGRTIWDQGMYITGEDPWYVELELYDDWMILHDTDTHYLNPYSWTSFEPPALFAPPHSDYVLDANGNGYYDWLYVDVWVNVVTAGWYTVDGNLYDTVVNLIASDSDHLWLNTGMQMVELQYSGVDIWTHGDSLGMDPDFVDLLLYDDWSNCLDTDTYYLSPYVWTDFEQPSSFAPPHSDYGDDTNANGHYDWLVVDVNLNIVTSGWYTVSGDLYDGFSWYIESTSDYLWLAAGPQTVTLYFDGRAIWDQGMYVSGQDPSYIYLELYDDWSVLHDWDFHVLSPYSWTSFEPPALLAPPHSDYGSDTNGNGYYDWLVVDVNVEVQTAGWYYLYGDLYDTDDWYITWDDDYLWLNAGSQTVTLYFDGRTIWDQGAYSTGEDPWYVELYLYDDWSNWLDSDTYYLGSYSWTWFEPPALFAPPYIDSASDTNGNGVYDVLIVETYVNVVNTGWYTVEGYLYDLSMTPIDYDSVTIWLTPGLQTVKLAFSGTTICDSELFGPYDVELALYDNFGIILDTDSYVTSAYAWTDFEKVVTLHLLPGWNFVSVPLCDFVYAASTLGLAPFDIVSRWDPMSQTYDTDYIMGFSGPADDFAILGNIGYWIWVSVPEDITLTGGHPYRYAAYNQGLGGGGGGGWVSIGFSSFDTHTASEIASLITGENVLVVSKWDASTQEFIDFVVGFSNASYDFVLNSGEACWVWVDGPGGVLDYTP